jgi:two-component system response regulator YesN
MMNAAMKQLAEDILSKYVRSHVFFSHTQIACIIQLYKETDIVSLTNIVNEVCMAASRIYDINLSAGISNVMEDLHAMNYAKNDAISALDYRLVLGDGKAIAYEDIAQDTTISLSFQEQDSKTLSSAIRLESPEQIKEIISGIFAQLYANKMALDRYHVFVMEIMLSLLKMMEQYQIDGHKIFAKNFDPYHPLTHMNSLVDFEKELVRICVEISRNIQEQRTHASKAVVSSVMEYIQ